MKKFPCPKIFLLLVISIVLAFSSCKKEEDEPDFVGTWSITYDFFSTEMKNVLKLSASSFESVYKMKDSSLVYIDFIGIKGSLSAKGDLLTFNINSVGITNPLTGKLQYTNKGELGFEDMLGDMEETFTVKYQVSSNKLTLSYDNDGDGIYGGENDVVETYTRD